MKLRIAAALLAALTPLTALAAGPAEAEVEVDITAPAVGSCHALSLEEGGEWSDPDESVPCTGPHTSRTVKVLTFDDPSVWTDVESLFDLAPRRCLPAIGRALKAEPKVISRSAYELYWFVPTEEQQAAGALWLRCDVVLRGGDRFLRLGRRLTLGDDLPLPDAVARCRADEASGFRPTACSRPHAYRATALIPYPQAEFPGTEASIAFAQRKCQRRMDGAAHYWEATINQGYWDAGYRWVVCSVLTED
ncbi:septum formation family protein [Nocardioides stalactiti]|uniref:septum formation family protein n=1 Tax=Nocardioides stalactiti TaxID=2755356 RepID=UPI0016022360|nr:septum formation family protein [Nocardioides stalactiti]